MFRKFHEKRKNDEGFTLIELLVVILIIAILAAIAIPVFLNQRKKGWISQTESALKNAATAQESWLTANPAYTSAETDLATEGFKKAPDVVIAIPVATATRYCMTAYHTSIGTSFTAAQTAGGAYYYDSNVGAPKKATSATPCA